MTPRSVTTSTYHKRMKNIKPNPFHLEREDRRAIRAAAYEAAQFMAGFGKTTKHTDRYGDYDPGRF